MQTLESLRESKGVTKVAIANYLGVSRPTYDWYEDNPHKMRVETALAVAEFLGVDVNEIFFRRTQELNYCSKAIWREAGDWNQDTCTR